MLLAASLIDCVHCWKARKSSLVTPSGGSSAQGERRGSSCDGPDGNRVRGLECPDPFFFEFPLFGVLVVVCHFFNVFCVGD